MTKRIFNLFIAICVALGCLGVPAFAEALVSGRVLSEDWVALDEETLTFDSAESGINISTDANVEVSFADGVQTLKMLSDGVSKYIRLNFENSSAYTDGKYYMELTFKQKLSANDSLRSYFGNTSGNEAILFAHSTSRLGAQHSSGSWLSQNIDVASEEWICLGVEFDLTSEAKMSIYANGALVADKLLPNKGSAINCIQFVTRSTIKKDDYIALSDFKMWKYEKKPSAEDEVGSRAMGEDWIELTGEYKSFDDASTGIVLPSITGLEAKYEGGSLVLTATDSVAKGQNIDLRFNKPLTSGVYYAELLMKQNINGNDNFRSYFFGDSQGTAALMLTHGATELGGKFNNGAWLSSAGKNISVANNEWIRIGVETDPLNSRLKVFVNGKEWIGDTATLASSLKMDRIRFSTQTVSVGDSLTFSDIKVWQKNCAMMSTAPKIVPGDAQIDFATDFQTVEGIKSIGDLSSVKAAVKITNYLTEQNSAYLMIVKYTAANVFESIVVTPLTPAESSSGVYVSDPIDTASAHSIKAFIWKDTSTVMPLALSETITDMQ